MRLETKVAPRFLPDSNQQTVLQLGLQNLEPAQWMQIDADFEQFQQHKQTLQAIHPEKIFFALPGSEAAQLEFHQLLVNHLNKDYGLSSNKEFESLWQSSLLVQEDVCLLEYVNNEFVMTAASVCSPSNWKLEDKMGSSLDRIHDPVPGYAATLSARVNRLFVKLKPEAPLLRFNWSIQNGNELFWRTDLQDNNPSTKPHWYWRVERQTLRRLPKTQSIVFTIRIYLHELASLQRYGITQQQVHHLVANLPTKQVQYKGLSSWLADR